MDRIANERTCDLSVEQPICYCDTFSPAGLCMAPIEENFRTPTTLTNRPLTGCGARFFSVLAFTALAVGSLVLTAAELGCKMLYAALLVARCVLQLLVPSCLRRSSYCDIVTQSAKRIGYTFKASFMAAAHTIKSAVRAIFCCSPQNSEAARFLPEADDLSSNAEAETHRNPERPEEEPSPEIERPESESGENQIASSSNPPADHDFLHSQDSAAVIEALSEPEHLVRPSLLGVIHTIANSSSSITLHQRYLNDICNCLGVNDRETVLERLQTQLEVFRDQEDSLFEVIKTLERIIAFLELPGIRDSQICSYEGFQEALGLNQWQTEGCKDAACRRIIQFLFFTTAAGQSSRHDLDFFLATTLDLSNFGLSSLPPCLSQIETLTKLIISNNPGIQSLPTLPSLTILECENTGISHLSHGNLPLLEKLKFNNETPLRLSADFPHVALNYPREEVSPVFSPSTQETRQAESDQNLPELVRTLDAVRQVVDSYSPMIRVNEEGGDVERLQIMENSAATENQAFIEGILYPSAFIYDRTNRTWRAVRKEHSLPIIETLRNSLRTFDLEPSNNMIKTAVALINIPDPEHHRSQGEVVYERGQVDWIHWLLDHPEYCENIGCSAEPGPSS